MTQRERYLLAALRVAKAALKPFARLAENAKNNPQSMYSLSDLQAATLALTIIEEVTSKP